MKVLSRAVLNENEFEKFKQMIIIQVYFLSAKNQIYSQTHVKGHL